MDDLYANTEFDSSILEKPSSAGTITEKEKFSAAKQILLGLAILYVLTIFAAMIRPLMAAVLLDISKTIFPPIATLILVKYFQEKWN